MLEKLVNELSSEMDSLGSAYAFELLLLLAGHHDYSVSCLFVNYHTILHSSSRKRSTCGIESLKLSSSSKMRNILLSLSLMSIGLILFMYVLTFSLRYLSALYRHSRFDTDEEGIPDEDSDFMNFRLKVCG